jgi:CMP-N-acetylneuraminic acid synthetase
MGELLDDTVSVVLARSGSVRFPDKNIAYLGSKRLLEWAIFAALSSGVISRIYVSTDSDRYAAIARKAGATPIMRPADLATETATSEASMSHALDYLRGIGDRPMITVLQQPTTPLTKAETIKRAVLAVRGDFDTALSVFPAEKKPWWAFKMYNDGSLEPFMVLPKDSSGNLRFPPTLCYPTGGVYAFKTEFFRRTNKVSGGRAYGVLVDWYEAIDIDYEHDLALARFALKHLVSSRKDPADSSA